jgi:predicted TPR repeat methyltransferase
MAAPPEHLSIEDALQLATAAHQRGHVDAAIEIYERVLAAAPDHVDALHFLGMARFQRGAQDEGVALVRRVLALAPDHADAHNNLGNMLLSRRDFASAEHEYRAAVALRPGNADGHANLGVALRNQDDLAGAEAAFRQALAIDPDHGSAHHNLARVLRDAGRGDEAMEVLRRSIALNPYDRRTHQLVGATLYASGRIADAAAIYRRWLELEPDSPVARHMLAATTGEAVPARAGDDFVQRTFDGYADTFDASLARLEYRAPALVTAVVAEAAGAPAAALDILDAGAGTGLCGPGLRPFARRLAGVDLSPRMLDRARERGCYDELVDEELVAFLRARPGAYDVIVSADTLVYFGAIDDALAAAAAALRPGGLVVFTLEHLKAADGFRLEPSGRYSHAEPYARAALAAAGFGPPVVAPANLRTEGGEPVRGLVVSARRP